MGWRFHEDWIVDNTAAAPWSTMAWIRSGGWIEMGVVGVMLGGRFTVVFAGGLDGEVDCVLGSTTVYFDCWTGGGGGGGGIADRHCCCVRYGGEGDHDRGEGPLN